MFAFEVSICFKNYPGGLSDYPGGDKMFVENISSVDMRPTAGFLLDSLKCY
jgi:hypothetical protein